MTRGQLAARILPAVVVTAVLGASYMISPVKIHSSLVASCGYSYGGYGFGPSPIVTGVSPDFGGIGGGTNVTITGSGFCNNSQNVQFGGTNATSFVLDSDSQIRAVSPARRHAVSHARRKDLIDYRRGYSRQCPP